MRKSDDRRARVLRAAVDVLVEQGPRGLIHRSVDERAGVSNGTASNHFRTRGQLLAGTMGHLHDALFERFYVPDDGVAGSEEELVARLTRTIHRSFSDRRRYILAWVRLAVEGFEEPLVREVVTRGVDAGLDRLQRSFIACGSTRARADAAVTLGYLHGLVVVHDTVGWPQRATEDLMYPLVRGLLRTGRPRGRRRQAVSVVVERRASGASRRAQVVDAATEVLVREGFRGLTHRNVDRHGGFPSGTTSNHFRTHQALVDAVQEQTMGSAAMGAYELLRTLPRTEAAMRRFLGEFIRGMLVDPVARAGGLFLLAAGTNPDAAREVIGAMDMWCMGYARWFYDVGCADPLLRAQLVSSFVVGMGLMHLRYPQAGMDHTAGVEPFVWGLLHG